VSGYGNLQFTDYLDLLALGYYQRQASTVLPGGFLLPAGRVRFNSGSDLSATQGREVAVGLADGVAFAALTVIGLPQFGAVRGTAAGVDVLFGQASVARTFTTAEAGSTFRFAGQSIAEVAAGLRSGTISASEIPVAVVRINGQFVAVNNRSLTALTRAGLKPTNIIDLSGDPAVIQKVLGRLSEMGGQASKTIRIRGAGPNASAIF
jgi:hypothetical protein